MKEIINSSGALWAMIGGAIAFILSGCGSAKGVALAGHAASGVTAEDSNKFFPCFLLQLLPSTQGIYGFIIFFIISGKISAGLSLEDGMKLFAAALPIAIVGLVSAIFQGKVAASAMSIVAKRSNDMVKGMMLCLSVELFALFGLLVSILLVGTV